MTYHQLFDKLRQGAMNQKQFYMYVKNISGLYGDVEAELELLKGAGAPLKIEEHGNERYFSLKTCSMLWRESEFSFVDIETNGSKPQSCDIIEIGALKVRGGDIIERFESYVYTEHVLEHISTLTGITQADVDSAPPKNEVLARFRHFLGDSIFVAHNVEFDYGFLDYHLRQCGMFGLLNPKLCTIDLARKTILSSRYALAYLNKFLGINTSISHRAYADALTAFRIFEIATMMFPPYVKSVQDLIDFSRSKLMENKR